MVTDAFSQDRAVTDPESTVLPTQLSDTAGMAERAWIRALESCANRMGLESLEAVADQLRQGNNVVRMHCCHGLAEQIAAVMRSSHQNIRAVYAPDCDACPEGFCLGEADLKAPFVHLLVWTQRKTPALSSWSAVLGNALARACQDMIGTQTLPTVLSAGMMDDADLEKLFGAGKRERWPVQLQAYLLAMNERADELSIRDISP